MLRPLLYEEDPTNQGSSGSPAAAQDNELQQLQSRLAALEGRIPTQQAQPQPVQQPTPQAAQPAINPEELTQQFWKNPLGMTGAAINNGMQRAVQEAVAQVHATMGPTLERAALTEVRSEDPELFDALLPEIKAKLQLAPEQYRSNADVIRNAFNNVKGENISKVLEVKGRKATPPTSVGGGPAPVVAAPHPAPREKELTDEQREVQGKMRMTTDTYKKGLEFYGNQDKVWGEVLTFDSATARSSRFVDRRAKRSA